MGKQRLEQKQYQNLSPQQIQFLGLLQTPIFSLEKKIQDELEENPALEEIEEEEDDDDNQPLSYNNYSKPNLEGIQIEDKTTSLKDYLLKQLIDLNLNDTNLYLIKYLIDSLDDNGFLTRDLYAISSDILTTYNQTFSEKELQYSLDILQTLEPIGVGTKDLQDCLLLQLKKLHPSEKYALEIISEYYTPFSNKNFEHLIKHLNLSKKELTRIYLLIESLNPIPAAGFSKITSSNKYIYADFKISLINNNLQLQINNGGLKKIAVSKYYTNLLAETTDAKTKEFLTNKIEKAKWFKESIQKREHTLKKVMLAIMEFQKDYLMNGYDPDLKPMKLADIAEIVKMDISTISRVSNSKYIETHFGTFKIKELFSDAYKKDSGEIISTQVIKDQLKKIIESEDKSKPLTDEHLAEFLGKEGYHIARRTVAKYRDQLGIETAKMRRVL